MSAPLLMLLASLLFSLMGVAVKYASALYGAGEIVMYRSLVGLAIMAAVMRWHGVALATPVPAMHFWRSATGVSALVLWFHSIGGLPLATATTLNYMSTVWIALFVIGGSVLLGPARQAVDHRLVAAALAGFAGVALVLRPTMNVEQAWYGFTGLLSGVLAAVAYLQVTALGRAGEPEMRVVFYFSVAGVPVGAAAALAEGRAFAVHTPRGLALLLAIGLLAALAQWMMTRAYSRGAPLGNAALQYMGIVFAFAFGVLLFGDVITGWAVVGMILIIGAGLVATVLRSRAQPGAAAPGEP
jgi:S-adenosylmethionine uptake transporter